MNKDHISHPVTDGWRGMRRATAERLHRAERAQRALDASHMSLSAQWAFWCDHEAFLASNLPER